MNLAVEDVGPIIRVSQTRENPNSNSSITAGSIFLDDAMICTTHNLLKLFALAKAA